MTVLRVSVVVALCLCWYFAVGALWVKAAWVALDRRYVAATAWLIAGIALIAIPLGFLVQRGVL